MYDRVEKPTQKKDRAVGNAVKQKQSIGGYSSQFFDNRPGAQGVTLIHLAANNRSVQQQPIQKLVNNTGLPDNMKSGNENLSCYLMNEGRVNSNSNKFEKLQAYEGNAVCQRYHVESEVTINYTKQNHHRDRGTKIATAQSNVGEGAGIARLKRHPQFPAIYQQAVYPNNAAAPIPFTCAEPKAVGKVLLNIDRPEAAQTGNRATKIDNVIYNTRPILQEGETIEDVRQAVGGYYHNARADFIEPCPTCENFIHAYQGGQDGQLWS